MFRNLRAMESKSFLHLGEPEVMHGRWDVRVLVDDISSQASCLESLSKLLAILKIAPALLCEGCRRGTLGGALTAFL